MSENTFMRMIQAAFVFKLHRATRAFLTSRWRNLAKLSFNQLSNYVIVMLKRLCSLHGAWKRMRPQCIQCCQVKTFNGGRIIGHVIDNCHVIVKHFLARRSRDNCQNNYHISQKHVLYQTLEENVSKLKFWHFSAWFDS